MKFEAILFDAAETLFTTRGSVGEIYASVGSKFGSIAPAPEIQQAFVRHFPNSGPLKTSHEKEWWRDVVHRVFEDVGMVDDFDRFFDEIYDLFRDSRGWMLFPETQMVLEACHTHGLKLGVISNFDSRLYSALKDLRILHFFNSITICSEVGFAKPHPEIFQAAIRSLGVSADRILFAGDTLLDDYVAGQKVGLEVCLLDRSDRYAAMQSVRRITSLRELLPIAGISPNS
jgi:putative hydrolase of the HAD superfamily